MVHWLKNLKSSKVAAALTLLVASAVLIAAAPAPTPKSPDTSATPNNAKVAIVNFKKCVESSKLGKQQQQTFEQMKAQMESLLQQKEKEFTDISTKLNDPDYLDGLTPEAENEMKTKFRNLNQELATTQNQFLQTLQQANVQIVHMLSEEVSNAAGDIAKSKGFDTVLNVDAVFYSKPSLDISEQVIAKMDEKFDRDAKKNPTDPKKTEKTDFPKAK